jgi:hypothetical protein
MANYSAASAAGTIFPIVGAGIGIGILAHTARGAMDTMYGGRGQYRRYPTRGRYATRTKGMATYRRPRTSIRYKTRTPRLSIPVKKYKPRVKYW